MIEFRNAQGKLSEQQFLTGLRATTKLIKWQRYWWFRRLPPKIQAWLAVNW